MTEKAQHPEMRRRRRTAKEAAERNPMMRVRNPEKRVLRTAVRKHQLNSANRKLNPMKEKAQHLMMKERRRNAKVAAERERRTRRMMVRTVVRKHQMKSEPRFQSDLVTINEVTQCYFSPPTT